jgi:hypothetical protein
LHIFVAGGFRLSPARFARDRFQPVQETRGHRRRAADLCRMGEDHLLMAKQLRKIVRGEADPPLRQVEAKFVPHRPAQPGIYPWRRRPHAFDQAAEDDTVGFRQPRFQLAEDVQLRARRFRAPHHPVGERGLEHVRIIAVLGQ